MCSWWDVSQALAEGTSMVSSCLWLIRDRWTVTSPKVVLKVNGRVPGVDTGAGFAAAVLQDQLLVGLLDEGSEEPALDLKAGLMDERLDLVGEVLVLGRHGQGHPQRQLQREGLIVPVDGAEVDGSLKAVGGTHGVSPYRSYGGASCVLFYRSGRESRYPGAESLGKSTSYLVHPASVAHQLAGRISSWDRENCS